MRAVPCGRHRPVLLPPSWMGRRTPMKALRNAQTEPDAEQEGVTKAARRSTPLTDPRSLSSSLVFHVFLVIVASVAALGVALPKAPPPPRVLHAELGPVD